MNILRVCAKCGGRPAIIRFDFTPPMWVCAACATEAVNAPHNIEAMERDEAAEELGDLLKGGGKRQ